MGEMLATRLACSVRIAVFHALLWLANQTKSQHRCSWTGAEASFHQNPVAIESSSCPNLDFR